MTNFKSEYDNYVHIVNDALDGSLSTDDRPGSEIYNAMKYSLAAGGKRLRPVLALAVCDLLGAGRNDVMPYACALEMIHTYSLIHDDLPAMDNDDYRRGMPTNHKVFGEALAVLAGDALLNKAYELMLSYMLRKGKCSEAYIKAMSLIAANAGADGMIRGQTIDMTSEGSIVSEETLKYMHRCKTGALIKASVLAAAIIGGASSAENDSLEKYAESIGLAFQIKDDIMDVQSSLEQMGKPAGSDAASNKTTYVSMFGLDMAAQLLDEAVDSATEALGCFGDRAVFLKELALFIKNRKN